MGEYGGEMRGRVGDRCDWSQRMRVFVCVPHSATITLNN